MLISAPAGVLVGVVGGIVGTVTACVVLVTANTWRSQRSAAATAPGGERLDVHQALQPYAENVKIVLQMFVGGGLAGIIVLKLVDRLGIGFDVGFLNDQVYRRPTLYVVGLALAYSSALELAYALFTRGPDEAVEPLIMGLAAAILIVVSGTTSIDLTSAAGIACLVAALAGLFVIRHFFILDEGWERLLRRRRRTVPASSPRSAASIHDALGATGRPRAHVSQLEGIPSPADEGPRAG